MTLVLIDDTTEPIQDIRKIRTVRLWFRKTVWPPEGFTILQPDSESRYYDSKRSVIERYQDLVTDFKAVALIGNIFPWYTIEKNGIFPTLPKSVSGQSGNLSATSRQPWRSAALLLLSSMKSVKLALSITLLQ